MKCFVVILALVALVSAEERKAEEKKRGLVWPLPDYASEGDLMLHGAICWDRVDELHKVKVEEEADKMILVHGRNFLRHVSKFFDDSADLKILPVLCHDSRLINNISRWRIEIPKVAPVEVQRLQRDEPLPKDKLEEPRANITHENETILDILAPSNSTIKPIEKPAFNSTEKPFEVAKPEDKDSFEARRREFYREVGANFARLLMKEYRKEVLLEDETEFLARWIADEAVHYGSMAIYCKEGEDIKEIKKRLAILLEEK